MSDYDNYIQSDADKKLESRIMDALSDYIKEEEGYGDTDVVTDFTMVFTRQMIDDQGRIRFANAYHAVYGMNPNAHLGMLSWGEGTVSGMMLDDNDDD